MPRTLLKINAGDVFARLTAVERIANAKSGRQRWRFACACGADFESAAESVVGGRTLSCGCLQRENWAKNRQSGPDSLFKHGAHKTLTGKSWRNMHQRCSNPRAGNYARYGGRGIQICDRWLDFNNFVADMGERPSPAHSIERQDNNGNYEPGNCRWATKSEQQRNRGNQLFEFRGRKLTLAAIYDEFGVPAVVSSTAFRSRVRLEWDIERALFEPAKPSKSGRLRQGRAK